MDSMRVGGEFLALEVDPSAQRVSTAESHGVMPGAVVSESQARSWTCFLAVFFLCPEGGSSGAANADQVTLAGDAVGAASQQQPPSGSMRAGAAAPQSAAARQPSAAHFTGLTGTPKYMVSSPFGAGSPRGSCFEAFSQESSPANPWEGPGSVSQGKI